MTGGLPSRDKGARGELEVLELVRAYWPRATRNFASGATGNSDIAHGPQGVVIEAKRTERLRLRESWRQVSHDARPPGAIPALPVLATRWNHGSWLAITELDELLMLLAFRERA